MSWQLRQKKENLLNVEYHPQKGLLLGWNLEGMLSRSTFTRHLFFILGGHPASLETALLAVWRKVKPGDFISCLFQKGRRVARKLRWVEKTAGNFDSVKLADLETLEPIFQNEVMQTIAQETTRYSNPVIVNFMLDRADRVQPLKSLISQLRLDGSFPYHVNFWGDFGSHSIDPNGGFNEISTAAAVDSDELSRIYRKLTVETAVMNTTVELSTPSMAIGAGKSSIWENVDFNRVRRSCIGPSIHYGEDSILLFDDALNRQSDSVQMTLNLEVTLISGVKIRAEKKIVVVLHQLHLHRLTAQVRDNCKPIYEFMPNVQTRCNSYGTETVLFLTKMVG